MPHSSYCHTVVVCTKITVIISKNNAAYPYQMYSQNVFYRCINYFIQGSLKCLYSLFVQNWTSLNTASYFVPSQSRIVQAQPCVAYLKKRSHADKIFALIVQLSHMQINSLGLKTLDNFELQNNHCKPWSSCCPIAIHSRAKLSLNYNQANPVCLCYTVVTYINPATEHAP